MQVLWTTWYSEVNLVRILVPFVSGINSRYQSIVDDRMKIERTSNVVNMLEESALNYHIFML